MIGLNARRQNKVAQVTSGFYNNPYATKLLFVPTYTLPFATTTLAK